MLFVLLLLFDDDESVVDDNDVDGMYGVSSYKPKSFSNSLGSLAPGKSCLFANISTGVPWLSGHLAVLISSILASSILSKSTESTTYMIPSVHLVYDLHKGLNFS